jgi:hypothetical protein
MDQMVKTHKRNRRIKVSIRRTGEQRGGDSDLEDNDSDYKHKRRKQELDVLIAQIIPYFLPEISEENLGRNKLPKCWSLFKR